MEKAQEGRCDELLDARGLPGAQVLEGDTHEPCSRVSAGRVWEEAGGVAQHHRPVRKPFGPLNPATLHASCVARQGGLVLSSDPSSFSYLTTGRKALTFLQMSLKC